MQVWQKAMELAEIDTILIGDSLEWRFRAENSTLPVTVEDMGLSYSSCMRRGNSHFNLIDPDSYHFMVITLGGWFKNAKA